MGIEPVRKNITVATSQEHAFHVFTAGMDKWWPREHQIGDSSTARTVLEPHEGGRWYSVAGDGSQSDVGRVLAWEPPRRVVLGWQLTAEWQYDAALTTEVEVTFVAEGPKADPCRARAPQPRTLRRGGARPAQDRRLRRRLGPDPVVVRPRRRDIGSAPLEMAPCEER
jgi:uncharacterized protein YndB with AHSA1/START domain